MATDEIKPPILNTPADFHFGPVNFSKPKPHLAPTFAPNQEPLLPLSPPITLLPQKAPLGVLSNFTGTFAGKGFNTIFRPNNDGKVDFVFPNPVNGPPIPQVPNENVLELNLTTETFSFSAPLGNVPNRGLGNQQDITLNGIPYVQVINDVTNIVTGKADNPATGIHFEPGLWMHVPSTTVDPVLGETLVRMASIPHGTTINAQCLLPVKTTAGPPDHPSVDMTPFLIGNRGVPIRFAAQTAADINTPRLPQDLSPFIAAGTITQEILDNPNLVLKAANVGKTITNTVEFTVTTEATNTLGGGIANIAFLEGTGGGIQGNSSVPSANADAVLMTATFWISTVEHTFTIPHWNPEQGPLHLPPTHPRPIPIPIPIPGPVPHHIPSSSHVSPSIAMVQNGHTEAGLSAAAETLAPISPLIPNLTGPIPKFIIQPTRPITKPITFKFHTTQIQYSQIVNLNFAGLTWPHISVATLVPSAPVQIPANAIDNAETS